MGTRRPARHKTKTLRAHVAAQPRDIRQNDVARTFGLTASQLSAYLAGSQPLSRETALRLSRAHGFDLEDLLDPARALAS